MIVIALAFLGGILLIQQLPELPQLWFGSFLIPLFWFSRNRPQLVWIPAFVAGMFWSTWTADRLLQQVLSTHLEGQDIRVEGVITDIPKRTGRTTRFIFQIEQAEFNDQVAKVPPRILLRYYHRHRRIRQKMPDFHAGDQWAFTVRLKRPNGFQNPGGFDYEAYLFRQGIRATGYIRERQEPVQKKVSHPVFNLNGWRQQLETRISKQMGDDELTGLVIALANGNRHQVQEDQWQRMRQTGTNHLIAISGLHIGLVAGFAFFLARYLWACSTRLVLTWPAQKAAAIAAVLMASFYASMAGFSVPTKRALIMIVVVMGALILQQRISFSRLLAFALILVLMFDPLASIDMGFWLSFSAVAVIGYGAQGRINRRPLGQLMYIQWAVAVGLLPLMLLFFQYASMIAPIANLIAVPVFGFVVVPLVLTGVLAIIIIPGWQGNFFFDWAAWVVRQVWMVLDWMIKWGPGNWVAPDPPWWVIVCSIVGVLLLLAPRGWPGRWLGFIWIAPLFVIKPAVPATGDVWLSLLDVGQGLAIVLRTREHTLVYDTGPKFNKRFDTGRAVVLPYLRAQGVDSIDSLLISHGDNDHIGGARSLLAEMPTRSIISSVPDRLPGAKKCYSGQSWVWDQVSFRVLHPGKGKFTAGNNSSCVLLIASKHGTILLTGDIEAAAEHYLIQKYRDNLAARILVAPHHGSKTSSSHRFLETVQPEVALIPSGYRNRYRHPHPAVLNRYDQLGIRTYASPETGAIEVRLTPDGMDISTFRTENKRYWFRS